MKAITNLYHDVVPKGDDEYSGFPGGAAALYKFDSDTFKEHIKLTSQLIKEKPITVYEYLENQHKKPFMLAFDDGGISAYTLIADILRELDWKGHFFMTTDYINDPRFINKNQMLEMINEGHVIGSHSASHPTRMSEISYKQMQTEWQDSKKALEDLLGIEIDTASIPGGYYSLDVAKTAAEAGFKVLFTSEPIQKSFNVDGCEIIGRYTIFRRMTPQQAAKLASGDFATCFGQWFYWNLKKVAKKTAGGLYLKLRDYMYENKK